MIHEVPHFYVGKLPIQRKQYIVILTMQLYGLLSDSTDLLKNPKEYKICMQILNFLNGIKFLEKIQKLSIWGQDGKGGGLNL